MIIRAEEDPLKTDLAQQSLGKLDAVKLIDIELCSGDINIAFVNDHLLKDENAQCS